ncbi:MAG: CRISPR-associated endonuclease Cas1 [Oculatellaceae cyanobacterium Prado106]|jgi:CRISPR-associated protein Cas1|nr:CRISPR-associated endonuclease Cas1 [Oculatellaceae cyanobacterium Prado106]
MIDWQVFLSAENFEQAWDKVRRNNGCAGSDGETIAHFARHTDRNLEQLRRSLQRGTYQPLPLRSLSIPKKARPSRPGEPPKTEWRGLSVPTVRDRIVQQALLNLLHPLLEPQFEDCSFAYRPGRSYQSAVRQVEHWRKQGYDWVFDADVVKYFDNIQHSRLYAELQERVPDPAVGKLVERWINSGVVTASGLVLPPKGIPQGSVVSPILANVYFDDFDEAIAAKGFKLVRFADDFVVLAKSRAQIEKAQTWVDQLLTEMGLDLHPDKTRITNFRQGFHFLGHTFVRSLILQDQGKGKSKGKQNKDNHPGLEVRGRDLPLLTYSDVPLPATQMQQAFREAIQESEQPVPPPLYVVMGYRVREAKSVVIESQELEWKAGMSTLYLVNQGTVLGKEQGRFVVKPVNALEKPAEVPIREVERILVLGNVQISTQAIAACLEAQIPVVFLSQIGSYKGHLWSSEFCDLPMEAAQYGRRQDQEFQLKMAQRILEGKLGNSRQLLLRLNRKRKVEGLSAKISRLEQYRQTLAKVEDLDILRGHEGAAAKLYFSGWGQLILNPGFCWVERSRRPPKDPINSMLSFGYTLLFNNVLSVILAEGLNPYLGNLHRSERKEPHLAFDLMEEWRSILVDSLVMTLINKKIVRPTDFTFPDKAGGIYLEPQARRVFLKHFEERISETVTHPLVQEAVSYRRAIQLQVQRYKRCLQNAQTYEAFLRST